jgi:uncharacterized membrane-anchored protein
MSRIITAFVALLLCSHLGHAKTYQQLFPDTVFDDPKLQSFVDSLNYQQGQIPLADANAMLAVPSNFYFLSKDDAYRMITEVWGNPPEAARGVLGMIFPASANPLDGQSWGAAISYDADGYVSDEDAEKIDYAELLKEMQEATEASNERRQKEGYPPITLIGWAAQPYYDRATHKLHWAKELQFGARESHTLNYDVRALGRYGVLSMNFVAGMNQLTPIQNDIPAVMAMPQFKTGFRYTDFVPGVDKVAAYGIGALVGGKVLAKTGLFVVLAALLKKFWIFVILALGGAWTAIKRVFTGGTKSAGPPTPSD